MSQVKSAGDDPDGDVRTGFPACFDRRAPLKIGIRRLFASGQSPTGKIFGGYLQVATLKSSCIGLFAHSLKIRPIEFLEIPRIDNSGMATADNQQSGSQQERLFLRDESLFPGILQLSAQSRCFSAFRYQGRIRVRARSKHIRSPAYRRRRKPADADRMRSRVHPLWPEAAGFGA